MAKPGKEKSAEPEILPDAWERFVHAVDVVIKSGPKHKPSGSQAKKTPAKERPKTKEA